MKPSCFAATRGQGRRGRATTYIAGYAGHLKAGATACGGRLSCLVLLHLSLAGIGTVGLAWTCAAAATGGSGGAGVSPPPVTATPTVTDVRCVPTPAGKCVDRLWVQPGGGIQLRGRYLQLAARVLFYGLKGKADDVYAPAQPGRRGRVTAAVPSGAVSGPVAVETRDGKRSRRWSGLVIDDQSVTPPLPAQTGPVPAIGARIAARKVFYGGVRKAVFSYRIAATAPVDVSIRLVRLADGAVVQTWQQPQVQPGGVQRVAWNGRSGGKAQPDGLYNFQTAIGAAAASQTGSAAPASEDAFSFLGHMFPVLGRHDFGGAGGRFGAGRAGHSHQGQDVFAGCGTPLAAARAGRVIFKGYHRLAGYYLVISGSGTGQDYVYAHLRTAAFVSEGDRVYTGQQIGEVGDTGNAAGCHLHFELWSAPGWYRGGRPIDPLPELRRWDKSS